MRGIALPLLCSDEHFFDGARRGNDKEMGPGNGQEKKSDGN